MSNFIEGTVTVLGIIVLITLPGIVLALPVMWLMNYLFAPQLLMSIFGVAKMGLWRTFFFNLFTGLAFKSYSASNSK